MESPESHPLRHSCHVWHHQTHAMKRLCFPGQAVPPSRRAGALFCWAPSCPSANARPFQAHRLLPSCAALPEPLWYYFLAYQE